MGHRSGLHRIHYRQRHATQESQEPSEKGNHVTRDLDKLVSSHFKTQIGDVDSYISAHSMLLGGFRQRKVADSALVAGVPFPDVFDDRVHLSL
jgi:hypothetical protein